MWCSIFLTKNQTGYRLEDQFIYLTAFEAFFEENGHCQVRCIDTINGINIGTWVSKRRQLYRKGKLPKEIIDFLESYPDFTWKPKQYKAEKRFEEAYSAILKQINIHGYLPAICAPVYNEYTYLYNRHQRKYLSKVEVEMLEALPGWSWDRLHDHWISKYELVKEIWRGRNIKISTVFKGHRIGAWCSYQRTLHAQGQLHKDRTTMLEQLPNWQWGEDLETRFLDWIDLLKEYSDEFGTCRITQKNSYKGKSLGYFTQGQRFAYKKKTLSEERIKTLEAIPGWSWKQNRNDVHFELLHKYARENGHTLVPKKYSVDGNDLGQFVQRNRRRFRKNELPQEIIHKFNQVPNWIWKRSSPGWEDFFYAVRMKCDIEGGFFIKSSTVNEDGLKIGSWCSRQRVNYKKGELDKEGIELIESIKGWEWSSRSLKS